MKVNDNFINKSSDALVLDNATKGSLNSKQKLSEKLDFILDKVLPAKASEFPPPSNITFPSREQILKLIVNNRLYSQNSKKSEFSYSEKDLSEVDQEVAQENLEAASSTEFIAS